MSVSAAKDTKENEASEHHVLVALSPQVRQWVIYFKQSQMEDLFATRKKAKYKSESIGS